MDGLLTARHGDDVQIVAQENMRKLGLWTDRQHFPPMCPPPLPSKASVSTTLRAWGSSLKPMGYTWVLAGMQNRTLGPYLAATHRKSDDSVTPAGSASSPAPKPTNLQPNGNSQTM
jgi:hypothetical protein